MRVSRKSLKELVDVAGIEPATPWLQRLAVRKISNLAAASTTVLNRAAVFGLIKLAWM